jgi:Flp pilus assembly protein TadG
MRLKLPVFARRWLRDRRGGAAIEFALVAPPFFMLLFGLVQVGWAFNCASTVRHALVQETRAFALNPSMTASQLQSAVRSDISGLSDSEVTVTVNRQAINGVSAAVASATYTASIIVPLLGSYPVSFNSNVTVPLTQT